eukprot:TRINITY_DN44803_c0_g1_i1.p1 TRINITY_DN44803_c0_g1~~TRINITY_DN44803_c0_g1_i1.p1  ORF type:complete len:288 (-),score=73.16 TRINITY_DN44803_c0_g1_i1:135-998(-)
MSGNAVAEREVLETFMRFDLDGNGTIDRRELTIVLQHIDPVAFTDAEVERILVCADTNGDGKIQVEEFVQWIFQGGHDQSSCLHAGGQVLRLIVKDIEHVAPSAIAKPPDSLQDVSLLRYALSEQAEGWYVEIVNFDAKSGLASLANGVKVRAAAGEAAKLERLLLCVPPGTVVSGLLERPKDLADEQSLQKEDSGSTVKVVDLEQVAHSAVARPPRSLTDPALLNYLAEEDREGWYVAIVALDAPSRLAVLTNGAKVAVLEEHVDELARLLASTPQDSVVSGLLSL